MATIIWEPILTRRCDRVGRVATLEVRCIYPSDLLPDQPPRVAGRRCSLGVECNLVDTPTCCLSGTLPGFDLSQG